MKRQSLFKKVESKVWTIGGKRLLFKALFLLFAFVVSKSSANNLIISNVSYTLSGTSTVTFDLSWNNGWRNTGSAPNNWDAAWVFVKFRDCLAGNATAFTHGLVSTTFSDHTFNGTDGGGSSTYEPTKEDGTVGIDDSPNNTGVMLRNASDPITGTFNARVTLKLTNLPASGTLDMRVFGIEMVYVPQSPYFLGDGMGAQWSTTTTGFPFAQGQTTALYSSYYVNSENGQTIYENAAAQVSPTYICPSGICDLTASFPKGYNSFFMMKYEITQGLYCDFLNASSSGVQMAHWTNQTLGSSRNTIRDTGNAFINVTLGSERGPFINNVATVSKNDRACNLLSWNDYTAYLDWAALRPLTELEYEKACRGILPPNNPITGSPTVSIGEYAWGNTVITRPGTITISGAENGTETVTPSTNCNALYDGVTYLAFTGGDATQGPLRVGIFAASNPGSRALTGMSYYGAMELTGNVAEYYISALAGCGSQSGPSINGVSLGDGYPNLSTNNHDVTGWPNPITPGNNIIQRGGSWSTILPAGSAPQPLSVSSRNGGSAATRQSTVGGRGGR